MKRSKHLVFFSVLVALWAGLVVSNLLTPVKVFSENENRYLAELPVFSFEDFVSGKYMQDMDEYINDQFILRNQWIGMKVSLERALLKKEIHSVLFARDNYLIEHHKASDVKEELKNKNTELLRKFMEHYGEILGKDRVRAMLIPTASEILKDKLPLFTAGTGFDQMAYLDEVEKNLGEEVFLEVSEILQKHNEEYIYYRTDHHWTSLGAYYAYQEWAQSMGFAPDEESDFSIWEATDSFYGTLHSKVNTKVQADQIHLYHLKNPMKYQITYNMATKGTSLYDESKLKGKDKYSVFLGGNNALVEVETENNVGRNLLVVKDSFAHSLVPFLVNHYDNTVMVDLRYYNGDLSALMAEKSITDVLLCYNVMGFLKDINMDSLMK